jgi:hypothetical protein
MKFPDHINVLGKNTDHPYVEAWGAIQVRGSAPKDWICPAHGKKPKAIDGVHRYVDGDEVCTTCAREWCEANWEPEVETVSEVLGPPVCSPTLFDVGGAA